MTRVLEMAKRKPSGDNSEPLKVKAARTRKPVELDEDLVRWIGMIVSAEGGTVPNWCNNVLRPIAKERLRVVLKGINEEFSSLLDDD